MSAHAARLRAAARRASTFALAQTSAATAAHHAGRHVAAELHGVAAALAWLAATVAQTRADAVEPPPAHTTHVVFVTQPPTQPVPDRSQLN